MVSLIFLKRSLVLLNLLFSSISLHCSVRKAFFFFFLPACYSLELCIQMGASFLSFFAFRFASFHSYQDGWVMVETSDKLWSTGEGKSKPLQYSCLENPINSMKRQKYRRLKDEFSATGDQWRNNSRKNEGMGPKKKTTPYVGCDDGSKV